MSRLLYLFPLLKYLDLMYCLNQALVIKQFQNMGYNQNCQHQNCFYDCCDSWGLCPSNPSNCYHYYSQTTDAGRIYWIVFGSILAAVFVVVVACYCYRKRQQERLQEEIRRQNMNNPYQNHGTTVVLQGFNQNPQIYGQQYQQNPAPYGQPIGQPAYYANPGGNPAYYGQPVMGQPVYHQQNNAYPS